MDVVDVIAGIAVALEHALDRYLGVAGPLSRGLTQAVVEYQFDAGTVDRFAVAGTVEQHVLHCCATQVFCRSLTEHPAHGINDVRFAAAVGTDNTDQVPRNRDMGGIDERFKTG